MDSSWPEGSIGYEWDRLETATNALPQWLWPYKVYFRKRLRAARQRIRATQVGFISMMLGYPTPPESP